MNLSFRRSLGFAAGVVVLAFVSLGRADTRDTSVPNNFINASFGFTSVSNTDVTISGNRSSWVGLARNTNFSVTLKDLEQKNAVWGGLAVGRWVKQAPISLGVSFSWDIYPAVISEQTKTNVAYTEGTTPGTFTSFTKFETRVLQMVPAFNIIAGVPLKFARIYAGVGPGMFMSFYSFSVKSGGREVGTVTASDVSIGFNAFVGSEFFITRRLSAYVEGKYSQVNNLKFAPDPDDPLVAGRQVQDEYDSIKTQRLGVGLSFHF